MISRRNVWRFLALALALAALVPVAVFGGMGSGAAGAFAAVPAHVPVPWQFAQPLENGPAVKPAPPYTAPPSARTADPLIAAALGLTTNATTRAISSVVSKRFSSAGNRPGRQW